MGKVMAGAGVAAIMVASMAVAQPRERLPAEYHQEMIATGEVDRSFAESTKRSDCARTKATFPRPIRFSPEEES